MRFKTFVDDSLRGFCGFKVRDTSLIPSSHHSHDSVVCFQQKNTYLVATTSTFEIINKLLIHSYDYQGALQFGIPPETLKDSIAGGMEVPQNYVVPPKPFSLR